MPLFKLTDDNNKKTTCHLLGYSTLANDKTLLLEIFVPDTHIKYLLHSDIREHNINRIESFITTLFDNALQNNKTVFFEEYLVRDYIYLGDGAEQRRQFTAQKV